ncbi:VOC family protein [Streptomyces lonarensis]|uniref:VOC family protein n=1 Tax=Streptomyces lonarensis TaxID=700599 RepID=A0A7X6D3R2_9ACTN|nr:VOC family protein [Streptomyces lonarensis]NJQ07540.1 VOC family protein [Streptomyces lonarensis]
MSGEITFFELGVEDPERARAFYGGLFGWTMAPGPDGGGLTVEGSSVPGGVHGGDPGSAPYLFFRVDDMDRALVSVRELGGVVEEMDIDGDAEQQARYGRFRLCRDDQGSPFGLHQPPAG